MSWNPDSGFDDSPAIAQDPRIVNVDESGKISIPWDTLQEKVASLPPGLLENQATFPLQDSDKTMKEVFENKTNGMNVAIAFIFENIGILQVHTPTLYALLQGTKTAINPTISTVDLFSFYHLVILGLSKNADKQKQQQLENSEAELNILQTTLFQNLMSNGIFQHYFTEKRHPDAPAKLCREIVQYTLRYIQTQERKILRLSGLGYNDQTSGSVCLATTIPLTTGEEREALQKFSYAAWKTLDSMCSSFFTSKSHPFAADPPTMDYVTSCDVFYDGANLAYCECILWFMQSTEHNPDAFLPQITE